jgi:hypothetical protein
MSEANQYPQIGIESHRNESARSYHVRKVISNVSNGHFDRPLNREDEDFKNLGSVGQELATNLFKIEGVAELWFHPYEVTVYKARMFSWAELHEQIMEAVKKAVGIPEKEVATTDLPTDPETPEFLDEDR